MSAAPDVLIVGAGPTGLALACELAWRRVGVRIVDRAEGPVTTSNALGVMPRTLELLENHGIVGEMLQRGGRLAAVNLYAGGRHAARIPLRLDAASNASLLVLPQRETERLLVGRLHELGVRVEWRTELLGVAQVDDHVQVVLRSGDAAAEEIIVPWLVGCDGVGSTVRRSLGIPFEGEAYHESFSIADLEMEWPLPPGEAHSFMSAAGLFFAVPLPGHNRYRLIIAETRDAAGAASPAPDVAALERWLHERTPAHVAQQTTLATPEWASSFRIQRRVVPSLRHGRVLLAGDAAHVHSPAGAQGMNTGIQDAVNLGWKLAAVQRGEAPESLVDSYDAERLPIARAVIGATHGLTAGVTSETAATLAGRVMGMLLGRSSIRRRVLATAYGMLVQYRQSPIITGNGRLPALRRVARPDAPAQPGDRAHDVATAGGRLYDMLRHPHMTLLAFTQHERDEAAIAALADALRAAPYANPRVLAVGGGPAPAGADGVLLDADGAILRRYDGGRYPAQLIRPDRYVAWRGRTLGAGEAAAALARAYGEPQSGG